MRPFRCRIGRHDWHSEYDHEHRHTTWTCQRCGRHKVTLDDEVDMGDRWTGGTGLFSSGA